MRPIKFRSWNTTYRKWETPEDVGVRLLHLTAGTCELEPYWLLSQFTGLHDKNGKEIYEGDVVHYFCKDGSGKGILENRKFVVRWDGKFTGYYEFNEGDFPIGTEPYGSIEIIGNIYENPDLLSR